MVGIERENFDQGKKKGVSLPSKGEGQRSHMLLLKWSMELESVGNNLRRFIEKYCQPCQTVDSELPIEHTRVIRTTYKVGDYVPGEVVFNLKSQTASI